MPPGTPLFPPPLASWNRQDSEAVALDIPFSAFSARATAYVDAFAGAMAAALGAPAWSLTVTELQPSSVGTALLYFNLLGHGTDSSSSAVTPELAARVRALFAPGAAEGAAAQPPLLARLQAAGLPVANAYYQDQLAADAGGGVGAENGTATWSREDDEVVALDIAYVAFVASQSAYSAAFVAAMASLLAVPVETVHVSLIQASSAGTTLIYFSRLLDGTPSTSSDVVLAAYSELAALFGPAPVAGSPALPAVVAAMQDFGLPLTAIYFQDQLS